MHIVRPSRPADTQPHVCQDVWSMNEGKCGPELFGGVFRMCSCSNVFGRVSGIIRCCSDVFESGPPPPPVCVPLPKPKIHPRNQPHRRQPHTHLKNYGRPRTVALPCHHWPRRAQALAARTWPRHEQHESLCHVNATTCGRVACANSQCDVAHVVLHTFRARACRHTTHANAI
jgi:hypothetical protein